MKVRGYNSMTANEAKRLKEWLEALGIPPKLILKCIDYIATGDTVHLIRKPKYKPKERKKEAYRQTLRK